MEGVIDMNFFKDVKNFNNQLYMIKPDIKYMSLPRKKLRAITLIKEEFNELMDAFETGDARQIAKELVDLIYVCTHALVSLFPDPEEIWRRVHQSNLSKFGSDAEVREDGKLLKSDSYEPPDLSFIERKF